VARPRFEIVEAVDPRDVAECRALFREYQQGLGVSLCFQGFEAELAALPGQYAPPRGGLYLATHGGKPAGCVALRALSASEGEMKRLYVRPEHRGAGLGRVLALHVIDAARALRYSGLKLDTLPTMRNAQALYAALGFRDAPAYGEHQVDGMRFMRLDLF
jgi:putative acetyltransferase